ncbi:Protein ABC1 homolog, mitochondrial [Sparassis crispa]|uniref:Protein ABC1 homolog, mitochondrial n=1 Tax=Sparassis crispa TaxID=139825 RepID=A0A401GYH8_9APHY|nr:Protein ABC1 homolog, mitochondrial [Sparassis crispa]GBE87014.1 Protein ABC1 homolog, mitochondrial [Sparassis crispa]
MPPGPAFNWFCVASSVVDILSNAARIRATQVTSRTGTRVVVVNAEHQTRKQDLKLGRVSKVETPPSHFLATSEVKVEAEHTSSKLRDSSESEPSVLLSEIPLTQAVGTSLTTGPTPSSQQTIPLPQQTIREVPQATILGEDMVQMSYEENNATPLLAQESTGVDAIIYSPIPSDDPTPATLENPVVRHLQSSKVPSSRIGRLFHYGGLAATLGYGAASELLRRTTSSETSHSPSLMLTEGNVKRLVSKLTQLRGAALKLGQFMSIQDTHVLPPEIEDVFRRVQDSAHYMPDWQMEEVLRSSLGPSWSEHFVSFNRLPFAAASIGQVHSAVLAASTSPTGRPEKVAVKIQFPNIVNSIDSDLGYVKMLLTAGSLLPKGLFLDKTIQVMKEELADECNYSREASFLKKFASPSYLGNDPRFKVPWVWEGSTDRVLVMEHVDGASVGGSVIDSLSQQDRDDIAEGIIELCLRELFDFRLMQTDPNWTNFLWNGYTRQIELVDFGATREYSKEFIDDWLHLLQAASEDDRDACIAWSLKVGYLTGEENEVMLDAHVKSMTLLATPFKPDAAQPFAFGPGSQWAGITAEIREQIPVMLRYRLTPPPRETYSLNRKLSGSFLLAARLNASVNCKVLWDRVVDGYHFGSNE